MRFARTVTAPATPASLFSLLGHSDPHSDGILLQLDAATVNYGTKNGTPVSLTGTIVLPSTNTKSVFVSGGGTVTVGLF
jgi:hypothetical protein